MKAAELRYQAMGNACRKTAQVIRRYIAWREGRPGEVIGEIAELRRRADVLERWSREYHGESD